MVTGRSLGGGLGSGSAQTIPIMPSRTVRASFWATVDRAGDRAAGAWVRWVYFR
jgi:hypothetical protein